jgi:hypothetical protein
MSYSDKGYTSDNETTHSQNRCFSPAKGLTLLPSSPQHSPSQENTATLWGGRGGPLRLQCKEKKHPRQQSAAPVSRLQDAATQKKPKKNVPDNEDKLSLAFTQTLVKAGCKGSQCGCHIHRRLCTHTANATCLCFGIFVFKKDARGGAHYYSCNECDYVNVNRYRMTRHYRGVHLRKNKAMVAKRTYSLTFDTAAALDDHDYDDHTSVHRTQRIHKFGVQGLCRLD